MIQLLSAILAPLVILLLGPFGLRLYVISNDRKRSDLFFTNVKDDLIASTMTQYTFGDVFPAGFIFGRTFVAYAMHSGPSGFSRQPENQPTVYLITTSSTMQRLLKEKTSDRPKEVVNVEIIERDGQYAYLYYNTRSIPIDLQFNPMEKQQKIIDKITDTFKSDRVASAFVYGPSGSGKTCTGLLLAKALNGVLCTTFNPTEPGDTLSKVMKAARPTLSKPLVIVLDEADIMIKAIHNQTIPQHKNIPTAVYDKRTFNKLFDDLFMFPYTVILMTSNEPKSAIDLLDPSYLRSKRVDICEVLS